MANALRNPVVVGPLPQFPRALARPRPSGSPLHFELALIDRVRAEFSEMSDFSPTARQAAHLFGLTGDECARVLDALVREGFLTLGMDGRYHVRS